MATEPPEESNSGQGAGDIPTGIADLEMDKAHSARMYDWFLGGITNFPADRQAAARAMEAFPAARIAAWVNRQFMHRSTRYLAEHGMDQFLDIGTGIPTSPNLHEVAQSVVPAARVVYTDNDPIVLAHAAVLMDSSPEGRTAYAHADVTDPADLLRAPGVQKTLDFGRPIALSLNAVLHFVPGDTAAHDIVDHLKNSVAPGSTLTITHFTGDFDSASVRRAVSAYHAAGTPAQARTRAEFAGFFGGWDLIEPGIAVPPVGDLP